MVGNTIRGVLFDLDGVLIDSRRAWYETLLAARTRFGYSADIPFGAFTQSFGQGVIADQRMFFSKQTPAEVETAYNRIFRTMLDHIQLMPHALSVLDELKERGLRLAIVTNTPVSLAQDVLNKMDIAKRVDAIAAAGEADEKPSPDLIFLALHRLSLTPIDIVYVGDSMSDRRAASAAKVRMIGLNIDGDARIDSLNFLLNALFPCAC